MRRAAFVMQDVVAMAEMLGRQDQQDPEKRALMAKQAATLADARKQAGARLQAAKNAASESSNTCKRPRVLQGALPCSAPQREVCTDAGSSARLDVLRVTSYLKRQGGRSAKLGSCTCARGCLALVPAGLVRTRLTPMSLRLLRARPPRSQLECCAVLKRLLTVVGHAFSKLQELNFDLRETGDRLYCVLRLAMGCASWHPCTRTPSLLRRLLAVDWLFAIRRAICTGPMAQTPVTFLARVAAKHVLRATWEAELKQLDGEWTELVWMRHSCALHLA